ncbi:MAG: nuclear transport factor 2 family protein [Actinomycetota bacterium]
MDARDRLDAIDATTRMAWLADRREWTRLVDVFADEVDVDYTSLTGGDPATVASSDLVAGWRAGLSGLDSTQHLVSNHLVSEVEGGAEVTAQFIATHRFENPHGDPIWTLGGHYRFLLESDGSSWRIRALTMTTSWATGNQQIMSLSASSA